MKEFIILSAAAADSSRFKSCVCKLPIGEFDDLDEARKAAHEAGGGAIFKTRQPIDPEVPGGRQRWGEQVEIEELEWTCLVDVIVPGTERAKVLGYS
jgi:hypothetical protein